MMIVKDAIHGNISVNDFEQKIIDSVDFQRLRRIKQLGVTYLVYPGATHTRFGHSLGTMEVASKISERLGVDGGEKEKVRLYALLHDVGHAAFHMKARRRFPDFSGIMRRWVGRKWGVGRLRTFFLRNFQRMRLHPLETGWME